MKRLIILFVFIAVVVSYGQSGLQKISNSLYNSLQTVQSDDNVLLWVFFKDKGSNNQSLLKSPSIAVSQKSLERRSKVFAKDALIDESDLPVNTKYIDELTAMGFKVKQVSKWFNGVSGYIKKSEISGILAKDFVSNADVVYKYKKGKDEAVKEIPASNSKKQPASVNSLDYGNSYTQNQMMNIPAMHNLGFYGQGVVVGIFDAGFNNLAHEVFSSMNIIARYDFVNNRVDVGDGNGAKGTGTHGTMTLSCLGGYKPGYLIGPAYKAKFVLSKTENTESETPVEEDNWIRAMEWADSIGIDVASTSLGYLTFDAPYQSYTWQNMDGKTSRMTIAADLAFQKGIVVINSAGNEGYDANHNTLIAPADGFNVITAGAVDASGEKAYFSSVGNTVDGRIKPDVMAMGQGVTVASTYSTTLYSTADGTSFSCPLTAATAAVLLSAKPTATPSQIRDALRNTASKSNSPGREYGWGIINALAAYNSASLPVELSSFSGLVDNGTVKLKWQTKTENNNRGFDVERSAAGSNSANWISVGFVKGNGTTTIPQSYTFAEKLLLPGNYVYRLKQSDYDGSYVYSSTVNVSVAVPGSLVLSQNYPNPFNPVTNIEVSIPNKSQVRLSALNILGQEVSIIYNGEIESGVYKFQFDGSHLASGNYFIRLTDGKESRIKKVILMK